MKSIIDAGGAVYQALAGTSSMGDHAVVIMGYSEVSGKYYAIMDPARGKYYDCIVNNSGVITHNTRMSADCVRDFSK